MTETARGRATQAQLETDLFESVHMWLRLNQEIMQKHMPWDFILHGSDYMQLNGETGAKGICYWFKKRSELSTATQYFVEGIKILKVEMHLNFRISTLCIKQLDEFAGFKFLFNEITGVETSTFAIEKNDYRMQMACEEFKHCL